MEYISTRLVAPNELTKDERKMLARWITKDVAADRTQVIKDILLALDYENIRFIANPHESESLKAVYSNPFLIEYITDPSETVQMAAVNNQSTSPGRIFNLIKNPSDSAWLALIKENPDKIRGMKFPNVEMQTAAISQKPQLISDAMVEWDDTIRSLAFKLDYKMFPYVRNPTEEECWEALRQDAKLIDHIKDPLDEMKAFAILVA